MTTLEALSRLKEPYVRLGSQYDRFLSLDNSGVYTHRGPTEVENAALRMWGKKDTKALQKEFQDLSSEMIQFVKEKAEIHGRDTPGEFVSKITQNQSLTHVAKGLFKGKFKVRRTGRDEARKVWEEFKEKDFSKTPLAEGDESKIEALVKRFAKLEEDLAASEKALAENKRLVKAIEGVKSPDKLLALLNRPTCASPRGRIQRIKEFFSPVLKESPLFIAAVSPHKLSREQYKTLFDAVGVKDLREQAPQVWEAMALNRKSDMILSFLDRLKKDEGLKEIYPEYWGKALDLNTDVASVITAHAAAQWTLSSNSSAVWLAARAKTENDLKDQLKKRLNQALEEIQRPVSEQNFDQSPYLFRLLGILRQGLTPADESAIAETRLKGSKDLPGYLLSLAVKHENPNSVPKLKPEIMNSFHHVLGDRDYYQKLKAALNLDDPSGPSLAMIIANSDLELNLNLVNEEVMKDCFKEVNGKTGIDIAVERGHDAMVKRYLIASDKDSRQEAQEALKKGAAYLILNRKSDVIKTVLRDASGATKDHVVKQLDSLQEDVIKGQLRLSSHLREAVYFLSQISHNRESSLLNSAFVKGENGAPPSLNADIIIGLLNGFWTKDFEHFHFATKSLIQKVASRRQSSLGFQGNFICSEELIKYLDDHIIDQKERSEIPCEPILKPSMV